MSGDDGRDSEDDSDLDDAEFLVRDAEALCAHCRAVCVVIPEVRVQAIGIAPSMAGQTRASETMLA